MFSGALMIDYSTITGNSMHDYNYGKWTVRAKAMPVAMLWSRAQV